MRSTIRQNVPPPTSDFAEETIILIVWHFPRFVWHLPRKNSFSFPAGYYSFALPTTNFGQVLSLYDSGHSQMLKLSFSIGDAESIMRAVEIVVEKYRQRFSTGMLVQSAPRLRESRKKMTKHLVPCLDILQADLTRVCGENPLV